MPLPQIKIIPPTAPIPSPVPADLGSSSIPLTPFPLVRGKRVAEVRGKGVADESLDSPLLTRRGVGGEENSKSATPAYRTGRPEPKIHHPQPLLNTDGEELSLDSPYKGGKTLEVENPLWFSIADAAVLSGTQTKTIRRAIQSNMVQFKIVKERYYINFASLISFARSTTKLRNKFNIFGLGQYVENWGKNEDKNSCREIISVVK